MHRLAVAYVQEKRIGQWPEEQLASMDIALGWAYGGCTGTVRLPGEQVILTTARACMALLLDALRSSRSRQGQVSRRAAERAGNRSLS